MLRITKFFCWHVKGCAGCRDGKLSMYAIGRAPKKIDSVTTLEGWNYPQCIAYLKLEKALSFWFLDFLKTYKGF